MSSGMDPKAAAAAALDDGADASIDEMPTPDNDPSIPTGADGPGLIDGLLETQPANTISEFPSLPPWAAHTMIGTIKFVNGIAGDGRELGGGKPAIVNFAEAGITFYTDRDSETNADTADDASAGDIGQVDR